MVGILALYYRLELQFRFVHGSRDMYRSQVVVSPCLDTRLTTEFVQESTCLAGDVRAMVRSPCRLTVSSNSVKVLEHSSVEGSVSRMPNAPRYLSNHSCCVSEE